MRIIFDITGGSKILSAYIVIVIFILSTFTYIFFPRSMFDLVLGDTDTDIFSCFTKIIDYFACTAVL